MRIGAPRSALIPSARIARTTDSARRTSASGVGGLGKPAMACRACWKRQRSLTTAARLAHGAQVDALDRLAGIAALVESHQAA